MTRDEAKQLLPIIKAFSEGKSIEFKDAYGRWAGEVFPNFSGNPGNYRIKPESKYRPFANAEECWEEMMKHYPFGWVKTKNGIYTNILIVNSDEANAVTGLSDMCCGFNDMFQDYAFYDGAPFGIEESEG